MIYLYVTDNFFSPVAPPKLSAVKGGCGTEVDSSCGHQILHNTREENAVLVSPVLTGSAMYYKINCVSVCQNLMTFTRCGTY